MEEYRAYVGDDGHFNGFEPLTCPNNAVAIEQAKGLVTNMGLSFGAGCATLFGLALSRSER